MIIKSDAGFFVEISHLKQHSISVQVGTYVQEGSSIAKCGNSGYSPEPHIHIQAQDLGVVAGFSKEFSFSEYIQGEKLVLNHVPAQNDTVTSVISNKAILSHFLFILDDTFTYDVYEGGRLKEQIEIVAKMDDLGAFYLTDRENNKLYFYNTQKEFYFYSYQGTPSYLKQFFILAPRIPFVSSQTVTYTDYLPIALLKTKWEQIRIELLSMVNKELYKIPSEYTFDGKTIHSKYGSVSLTDHHKGLTAIQYDNIELKQCSSAQYLSKKM